MHAVLLVPTFIIAFNELHFLFLVVHFVRIDVLASILLHGHLEILIFSINEDLEVLVKVLKPLSQVLLRLADVGVAIGHPSFEPILFSQAALIQEPVVECPLLHRETLVELIEREVGFLPLLFLGVELDGVVIGLTDNRDLQQILASCPVIGFDDIPVVFKHKPCLPILLGILNDEIFHFIRQVFIFGELFQSGDYIFLGQANTHRGIERKSSELVLMYVLRPANRLCHRNQEVGHYAVKGRGRLQEDMIVRRDPDGALLMAFLQLDLLHVVEVGLLLIVEVHLHVKVLILSRHTASSAKSLLPSCHL